MKQTLLILVAFISINCFGQETEWHSVAEVLLIEYSEYETECYNDSTEIVWFAMPLVGKTDIDRLNFDDLKKDFPDDILYLYSVYEHKQPTFPDFMEWLKTKYEN